MGTLEGKVALITGGGKGIGRGIALKMIREGAKVAIGYHSSPELAQQTLTELQALGPAIAIQADVGTPEGCRTLVEKTVGQYGKLDILVNNAALQTHHTMLESNMQVYDLLMRVNLRAAFLMMQYSLPYLKQSKRGRIIIITSVHGKRPTDFDAAYAISKGALKMLYREAAIEFARYGITVNAIAPGAVSIEGKSGSPKKFTMRKVVREKQFSQYPLGRVGVPEDIGAVAAFIAGDQTDFLSGATIRVDGASMLL